jgi:FkbM family methyltransferase
MTPRFHETWLKGWFPLTGSTFVDVGANHGEWLALMDRGYERMIAIEPNPELAAVLVGDNLKIHAVGAWSMDAENRRFTTFERDVNTTVMDSSTVPLDVKGAFDAPCRRIDTLLAGVDLGVASLIKIDVEGAERDVLDGARDTIERFTPGLIIEIHSRELGVDIIDMLINYFNYNVSTIRHPAYAVFSSEWYTHFWISAQHSAKCPSEVVHGIGVQGEKS